ncbi:NAD-dependent succinate-semialdehyde dehydrogenase [Mycobacterium sp. 48b]|uniref:NAD-dependent succinate-semialdehyde dehydrogenase n=1 Tax=Mycobacterium sp. 48b TaxID=3400426 RepID=UPI003AAF9FCA
MDIETLVAAIDPEHGVRIGGQAVGTDETFAVTDPATAKTLAHVSSAGAELAAAAVDSAASAFTSWRSTAPRVRSEILRAAYELMISNADMLTTLICAENGKPQSDARAEVGYAAEFFRWFSEEAVRTDGSYGVSPAGAARTVVTHRPVGVAALITPWNFPAAMATRKIAPALAAGCTVVLKPARETPLTALAIADILARAGVPHGVVNVVPTTNSSDIVGTWLSDERVRKVSFTGSTQVGRALLRQAADRVVNASMELGGNAPFVVSADADIAAAVDGAMIAKFRGSGQACTAANRFYVHAAVVDQFVEKFGGAINSLRVGPATDPGSQVGPLINARAVDTIQRLINDAVAEGANIAASAPIPDRGFFLSPTLLADVQPNAAILTEEIFGPVAPVVAWDDEDELLSQINNTEYGLAAYVYSGRLQDALRVAEQIDAGMVGVNRGVVSDPSAPFGGTKQSGLGREGARIGLHEFLETQYFSIDE